MCRYVSSHIRDLLSYPCFTEAKIHKEILSTVDAGIELSSQEIMNRFVLKKRDEIANYVLIGLMLFYIDSRLSYTCGTDSYYQY